MRIVDRYDWGRLARIHALDDRQYRDPQACPPSGRGGSNTLPAALCPGLDDPRRSLLGMAQERWLAEGWDETRPWNLLAQQRIDEALPFNPHLHHARADERGYVRFTLDQRALQAELRVVDKPLEAASPVRTAARFAVEAGRAGVQKA
jgi:phosphodiesterase/alkaline phosphatase D-like protein